MTTVTGQFAVDFTGLGNANPYTNASLSYGTADQHQILSAVNKPTGFTDRTYHYYNGSMLGTGTIKSKIEVGANPGAADKIYIWLVESSAGAGYSLEINGTSAILRTINDWAWTSAATLTSTTLGAAPASGDTIELWKDLSTNDLRVYINSSLQSALNATDSSTTSGLRFGHGFSPENGNAANIKSFAGDGIAGSSGTSLAWIRA
tara:strand:+ start:278 stop:892 length:615 start_codon:yes stop_codon:yes gene_type:complete